MRVLYVEDDRALAAQIGSELSRSPSVRFVRHASTLAAAEALADAEVFDVALVDLALPDGDGVDLIAALADREPPIPSLAHTLFDDRATVLRAVNGGAQGYITKDQPIERLAAALGDCVAGGCPLASAAAAHVVAQMRGTPPQRSPLTERESDVILLIAKGLTYGECADVLGIGVGTVQGYVRTAYRKLDINSKAEAAIWATRRGLV